jgi:Polyketide cyclase / dehydrase and lipid transport
VKELTGHAERTTPASPDQCMSLLEALDGYPNWYPEVVKSVEVLERDAQGRPTKAQTGLHVQHGPLTRDFNLLMDVQVDPAGMVKLSRIPHHGGDGEKFDVAWHVSGAGLTQIRLDLAANLNVPRFLPLGDVGKSMAAGFVNAATRALTS